MTRDEAQDLCARFAAEHPDRANNQWRPREAAGGSWSVVKIALPPQGELTLETRADEKPPTAEDPRTAAMQNLGPHVGPVL